MDIQTERYTDQQATWPHSGRVILANFDAETIVVYQAYRPEIANYAITNQCFGGDFKTSRMSWIKPNFLWMMYRSGWASKQGQEVVLAVRIRRSAFDRILSQAVYSTFKRKLYESRSEWQAAVTTSDIRLQWDPDHAPDGSKLERRAIQLGLRGDALGNYSKNWIVDISDVTPLVTEQRENSCSSRYDRLLMPRERIYPVADIATIERLRLDFYS